MCRFEFVPRMNLCILIYKFLLVVTYYYTSTQKSGERRDLRDLGRRTQKPTWRHVYSMVPLSPSHAAFKLEQQSATLLLCIDWRADLISAKAQCIFSKTKEALSRKFAQVRTLLRLRSRSADCEYQATRQRLQVLSYTSNRSKTSVLVTLGRLAGYVCISEFSSCFASTFAAQELRNNRYISSLSP